MVQSPFRPIPPVETFSPDAQQHIHVVAPIPVSTNKTLGQDRPRFRRRQRRRDRRSAVSPQPFKPTEHTQENDIIKKCAVYSYNVQLKALANKKDLTGCLRLLDELSGEGYTPDKYTYSTILSCCSRSHAPDVAMDLYNRMMTENVPVDDYIRTNLLTCAANASPPRLETCASVFRSTSRPSKIMCNVMMDAYARAGLVEECLSIYRYMSLQLMAADKYTVSALVKAYVTSSKLEEAVNMLHEMHEAGLEVHAAAYGQVMDAFGRVGHLDEALRVFDTMTLHGVKPTQITYNILIGACERSSMTEQAFEIFEEMKATTSFSGDRYTLHSLMKCCIRSMNGWQAFDIYRKLKKSPFPCNQVSYRLALIAAGQTMDLNAIFEVADDIEKHKSKMRNDTAAYFVAALIRCSDLKGALKSFGNHLEHLPSKESVLRFFSNIRTALQHFEEHDPESQRDFEFTSLVVNEMERSWRRGL